MLASAPESKRESREQSTRSTYRRSVDHRTSYQLNDRTLSLLILAIGSVGTYFVSDGAAPWLPSAVMIGLFSLGLSSLAIQLLPGKITFKKAGIVATGGIALFLTLLFWLKSGSFDGRGFLMPMSSETRITELHLSNPPEQLMSSVARLLTEKSNHSALHFPQRDQHPAGR
jgi:hypothetical protein